MKSISENIFSLIRFFYSKISNTHVLVIENVKATATFLMTTIVKTLGVLFQLLPMQINYLVAVMK